MRVGLRDARFDLLAQRLVRDGEAVDLAAELADFRAAFERDAVLGVDGVDDAQLFGHAGGRARISRKPPLQQRGECERQKKRERHEQPRALAQHGAQRIALRRIQVDPQRQSENADRRDDHQGQHGQPEGEGHDDGNEQSSRPHDKCARYRSTAHEIDQC